MFYVFVLIGDNRTSDKFFVLSQDELRDLYDKYRRAHPEWDGRGAVLTRAEAVPFENKWDGLPGWAMLQSN